MIKRYTHTYEMIVVLEVDVPDDWTEDEERGWLVDFPLEVTIHPDTDDDFPLNVGLILDSVVSGNLKKLRLEVVSMPNRGYIEGMNTPSHSTEPQTVQTAQDVTSECLTACEEIFDGWYSDDSTIDWFSFFDRLEEWGWSVKEVDSPAVKKIQRHVRKLRA